MLLFFGNKKKKEDLKILSENEIQSRLYGKYRSPQAKPAGETPAAEPAEASPDLFNPPKPSRETPVQPAKVESWIRQEQHAIHQEVSKLNPSRKLKPPAAVSIGSILANVSGVLTSFAKGPAEAFSKVNFSDSRVRNGLYWLGAVSFLAAIFMAIHILNIHREKAMKAAPKAAPTETAEETDLSLPPELLSETAETPQAPKKGKKPGIVPKPEWGQSPVFSEPVQEIKPYVVQVATYVGPRDAERMAALIQGEGFPAFVQELRRQNGKVYHCVFIGRFKDYREAESALESFRRKEMAQPFQDAFVRTMAQA